MENRQEFTQELVRLAGLFFEGSPLAVIAVDPKSRQVCYANPAFIGLFPIKADFYGGLPLGEILPEGEAAHCLGMVERLLRTGKAETVVHQSRQPTGRGWGYWSYTVWAMHRPEGDLVGVFVEVADQTEAMRFRSRSREMNDALLISSVHQHELAGEAQLANEGLVQIQAHLEELVAQRTLDLEAANRLLEQQIARLEQTEGERRRLLERLSASQEEERRRISRELHDHMGQLLAGLQLRIQFIADTYSLEPPARERLLGLQSLVGTINQEMHQLALELRPRALDDLGLAAALTSYLEEWSRRSQIAVDFQALGLETQRIPSPIETAFYRVTQEALTNVVKHSGAKKVSVIVRRNKDQAVLVIEDDGVGFHPKSGHSEGRLGLLGIRERIESLGGSVAFESPPGGGTTIIAKVFLNGNGAGGGKTNSGSS